ncbi:MAG: type II and III secretion system protein [Kiritimatiellaeota bacterium]|nr:type II and III secretion system protein [Kiritimatiellota bacterium]
MRKLIATLAAAALAALTATAQDRITLAIGEPRTVDLPILAENYKYAPQDVIKVTDFNGKQMRLLGLRQGDCELEVMGGGVTRAYSVVVVDNIRKLYDRLLVDLDDLPELDITINQDYIVIKGEVSDIAHWKLLRQVLPRYVGACENRAVFRPSPENLIQLKKLLEQSGFAVSDKAIPDEANQIGFQFAQNIITLTGRLYTQKDVEQIARLLSTQDWLHTDGAPTDDGRIRVIVNTTVDPVMIDVGAVYAAISKGSTREIGSEGNPLSIEGNFGYIFDIIAGRHNGSSAVIGGSLNNVIKFLAENGVSRFKTAGHLSFISNNERSATFHSGGTVFVRVQGKDNGDLKEVPYGLAMTVSGGLIGGNKVKLDIEVTRDDPPLINKAGDYDQKKNSVKTSVVCELGKTVALGGMKDITESTVEPSGVPYLRNVPVLNWFFAHESNVKTDLQLVILVSPRVQSEGAQIEIPPSIETDDTLYQADRPNAERIKDGKRRGFWSWLGF